VTKAPDEREHQDQQADEDVEVSKETIQDLDSPEESAEAAKGGGTTGYACP
jgi:hypothetical protein